MAKFGISTALLTPFTETRSIDWPMLVEHVQNVLARGADSVTLFGTTGEGASISHAERIQGLEKLIQSGCPPGKIILGVCATACDDAIRQVEDSMKLSVHNFLLMPPFFFPDCKDEGIIDWHHSVLSSTDPTTRFVLYNLPQITGITVSPTLVERLCDTFSSRILAIKDSSGSWDNAQALLMQKSVQVLIGDERLLHRACSLGGAGAISGMANLYPERLQRIVQTTTEDVALSAEVSRIVSLPVIAAIKTLLAVHTGNTAWERLRAPLSPLTADERAALLGNEEGAVMRG